VPRGYLLSRRSGRAFGATAIAAAALAFGLASAHAGLVRVSTATPIVPPDNRAYIFDTFGNQPDFQQSLTSLNEISSLLDNESYRVIAYRGAAATLANFAKMKGAGVIVLSTHGYDPRITHRAHRTCEFGKGLFRTLTPAQVDTQRHPHRHPQPLNPGARRRGALPPHLA
jgi:hypothetical protein